MMGVVRALCRMSENIKQVIVCYTHGSTQPGDLGGLTYYKEHGEPLYLAVFDIERDELALSKAYDKIFEETEEDAVDWDLEWSLTAVTLNRDLTAKVLKDSDHLPKELDD